MSEYGDYSDRLFNESQRNSFNDGSSYEGELIDFNQQFSFSRVKISNPDYQDCYLTNKNQFKDTAQSVGYREQINKDIYNEQNDVNVIKISENGKREYLKVKKGTINETMELNTNFKTIFCRIVRQMCSLRLLKKQEKALLTRYKNESASFKSLQLFLNSSQNKQSRLRLVELLNGPEIVRNIFDSNIELRNKLKMLKYLQIMRKTIDSGNPTQKWKQNNIL